MKDAASGLSVLIKHEGCLCIAHCLELDIVAVAETEGQAVADLNDLIFAQISSAAENDNLEHLLFPAPASAWAERSACIRPEV